MPANPLETLIAFGKSKQTNISTPNTAAGIWRLGNKLNASFGGPKLVNETDQAEIGKGHEYIENIYKSHWDVAGQLEKYASAEFLAWAMVFGLGKSVKTGGPNYIYTCTPLDPIVDGIELPSFSYAEQIRPGATAILDRLAIGCVINDFTLSIASGPGRASAKLVVNFVGTGKHANPSIILIPAKTAEKLLASASLALTVNTVDYVTAKKIISLEWSWNNNIRLDSGFYPGSGFQGTGTQLEVIRLGGTSGTANITLAGGLTKLVTFNASLTQTATDFVTNFAAGYAAAGITLTSVGPYLKFLDAVPGTGITAPAITNATGNQAGKVYHSQANGNQGDSGAVRGRMEVGTRQSTLKFTARVESDSIELDEVEAQTEGTAVFGLTYDANNSLTVTHQRVQIATAELGDTDGFVTVTGECAAMWHTTNGLVTAVAKCAIDGIGAVE